MFSWYVYVGSLLSLVLSKMHLCSDAIFSHRVTSKLVNDNTEAFYRMSKLYYELGEEEDSLRLDHICNITHW